MKSRSIRGRLDDIAGELPPPRLVCALHGDLCQMGARWPVTGAELEFYYLIREARIAVGAPVKEPDPFTVDEHRPQSAQERQEVRALLDAARAKVAEEEAEIIAGGDPA